MAATRKCLSTDDEFRLAGVESLSVRQVLGRIGLVPAGGNYKTVHARIARLGLDTSHFTGAGWNVGARYKGFGRKATLAEILALPRSILPGTRPGGSTNRPSRRDERSATLGF